MRILNLEVQSEIYPSWMILAKILTLLNTSGTLLLLRMI